MTVVRPARLLGGRFSRFFDWATVGPISLAGVAGRDGFLARLDESDHPAATLRQEAAVIGEARSLVGRFLGATEAHRIVFGRSVSALFSLVVSSLSGTKDRSTVVVTDIEHPMSMRAARCPDLRIVVVQPTDTGLVDLDAVAAAVDERCVAVCAAHVARVSGVVQPVAALAQLAHDVGAVLIVDGAQATGRVPVDLRTLGCDVYLGSGQKSLLAGSGITFMAATVAEPPHRFEPEPPDLASAHTLRASVAEFLRLGIQNVHQHITGITSAALDAMTEIGLPRGYRPDQNNAGILSYDTARPADELAIRLRHEGFVVSPVDKLLRVSVHLPNSVSDVVDLAKAIRRHS